MLAEDKRGRLLARLRNFAQEYRKGGGNLVLLATWCSDGDDDDYFEPRMMRKMGICNESCVTINPVTRTGLEGPCRKDGNSYLAMINTRRLKRSLREKLVNGTSMDFLHMNSDWGILGNPFGHFPWPEDELKRATLQIVGKTLKNPVLGLPDIEIVLRRLNLCITPPQIVETVQSDKADNSIPWKEKIDRLKGGCNEFEEKLLDSVVNPVNLELTYDDVIIDSESKETMKYLVSMSNFCPDAKSSYLLNQIRINGALLYGPPGTGKTHLSRAIAKDSGMNMIAIDSASITSRWSGETEKFIKASFTLASKLFPCVLFIDEVDALFYRRDSDDKSWQRSALAQFLQCLDGLVKEEKGPFVIAATNRPSDLDDAFLRRLPQKLFFKLPDAESRLKILRLFLKDEDIHSSLDVEGLAKVTEGYSGSDIRSLCGKAAMIWAIEQERPKARDGLKGKPKLCLEARHFGKALQNIRPSVSEKALAEFTKFAKQYNANDFKDSSSASYTIDERCFTKSVVVSDEA
ncbi:P-loop containing nucleoside triphosphate hydrolase protein [Annulohypoxylon truncatum]|uniref:P-loop containing nucleoside triphosphate hydrolase protein n=1 Tax=Annulohypoxylon truncatum TaxID=327061 RepID=UPI0020080210|nr:P-loop containing nucleoside triphosphate hydrolase protein [Annulohypoxylon truncatum]KAI1215171.1 P-loop containing nucleoside triphosphate hydrolase protein [Annulohypoxylon truncatum]